MVPMLDFYGEPVESTGMDTPGRMLTKADVAALLGISPRTVQRKVAGGELPAVRISSRGDLRFDPAAITAYLTRNAA